MKKLIILVLFAGFGLYSSAQTINLQIFNMTSCPAEFTVYQSSLTGCHYFEAYSLTVNANSVETLPPANPGYEYYLTTLVPGNSISTYAVQNPNAQLTLNPNNCENVPMNLDSTTGITTSQCGSFASWINVSAGYDQVVIMP